MSGGEVCKRKAESEYVDNPVQVGGKCWFGVQLDLDLHSGQTVILEKLLP